ncbi:hypothetical protein DITRI_Ditri10aG0011900 [Diplodiscus trichospermus]
MSRCFPYPPPGYLKQGLVKSIKLEREKVLPKTKQNIRKRKKEEKRKERKEKEKAQGLIKKYKKLDDVVGGFKDDQLEKSDITEEHEPPVYHISDVSHNSNKRKRETISSTTSECRVDGNVIKIKFSLKKLCEPDASLSEDPACSTSGRADSSTPPKAQDQCYPCTSVPERVQWCGKECREPIPSSSAASVSDNRMQKAVLQYKTLIEDWMPLPLQVKQNDDDDDWLFMTKQQGKPMAKRFEFDNVVKCRVAATSCPSAYLLPEVDIYALPYTVPF